MIDFHAHFLPGIDDGSSSVEESVEMLRVSYHMGVTKIVATPHFYADRTTPEQFLAERDRAWERLAPALPDDTPAVLLGAEVCYYTGISHTERLSALCMEGTNVLLLEMPFHKWTTNVVGEVVSIAQDQGLTVLLAHIDRYLSTESSNTWRVLAEHDVLFQVNASFFLDGWFRQRQALKLLRVGKIAALGSDCHNMENRKPNLAPAFSVIRQKAGEDMVNALTEQEKRAGCKWPCAVRNRMDK
ncbi:MAG: capsular polysaccharide biosynthesis protein [Clostridiales bacterium]|nr:capsular polysaccharide biosynthesis protein [Clostridiales bacterium]